MQADLAKRPIAILGTGQAVSSAELDLRLRLPPGTIQQVGGLRQPQAVTGAC